MSEFVYGKSLKRGGYTWYCQTPGILWKTDPVIGWELFLTDGGWLLIGPECMKASSGTEKLMRAMEWAAPIVAGDKKPWDYE